MVPAGYPRLTDHWLVRLTTAQRPLLVGERISATGSRSVRQMLLRRDYAEIAAVGRRQIEAGARALDVSTVIPGLDGEAERMLAVIAEIRQSSDVPLLVDAIDAGVQVQALGTAGAKVIVNSINLARPPGELEQVVRAAIEHRAAVVLQTIDERGMARTGVEKLGVAMAGARLLAERHGMIAGLLIVDPLLFPLYPEIEHRFNPVTETLDGLRRIKAARPDLFTILGISNLSFGLPSAARPLINSVFLRHAVAAGLDLAIVDPAKLTGYDAISVADRALSEDLLFRRRPDALSRYLRRFQASGPGATIAGISATDPERCELRPGRNATDAGGAREADSYEERG